MAQAIRKRIREELQLTASAGIANSKFLAKIASDWNKPDGQFTIAPHEISDFVKKLPVKKIPGVGKATLVKMQMLEVDSCEDLQRYSLTDMRHHFGSFGDRLYDLCRGVDHSVVKPSRPRKSISVETTFSKDLDLLKEIKQQVDKLFTELEYRMQKSNVSAGDFKSLQVKFKTKDFAIKTKEKALPFSRESFIKLAEDHFYETGEPIRLLGIGCKLDVKSRKKSRGQLDLF